MARLQSFSIPSFYKGRSIFITGGTGFLGRVLVDRLLTTCPDIGKLYLLMREKKGVTPKQRLHQHIQSPVFDALREKNPHQLEKMVVVSGDLTCLQLGLTKDDLEQLKEVTVVLHLGASIRLQDPLVKTVEQNLRPTTELLDLCDTLPNVEVLIYVSTIYCNGEHKKIEEKVYPPPMNLKVFLDLVDHYNLDEESTRRLIAPKGDTYLFTKAMTESIVARHGCTNYSVAIFRPAILVSSLQHPFPGWAEGYSGPNGVIAGASTGLLKVFSCKGEAKADIMPVDITADTLIAVACEVAVDKLDEVRVYNCSAGDNPTTWRYFTDKVNEVVAEYPSCRAVLYPHYYITGNRRFYLLAVTILQTIPFFVMDCVCRLLCFKRQKLVEANQKIIAMVDALEYYGTHGWDIDSENIVKLQKRLCEKDSAFFKLDPNIINWNKHLTNMVKYNRKYVLRESESSLDKARSRIRKLAFLDMIIKSVCLFAALKTLYNYLPLLLF